MLSPCSHYLVPLNCCRTHKTEFRYTRFCSRPTRVSELLCVSQRGDRSVLYSSRLFRSLASLYYPRTGKPLFYLAR